MAKDKNILRTQTYDNDIIYKTVSDIIDCCNFEIEDEKTICEDIILSVESFAAKTIRQDKIAQLPLMGTICRSKKKRAFSAMGDELKEYRNTHTKEEYKEFCFNKVKILNKEIKEENEVKKLFFTIRHKNRHKFDYICKNYGLQSGQNFINIISRLKPIPFDEEVEETCNRLLNEK